MSIDNFISTVDMLLDQRNITRPVLCKAIDISTNSFSTWKIRNTYPAVDVVIRIADFFDVSVEYLFSGKETNTDYKRKYESLKAQIQDVIDHN